jgi:hypothetical protein
MVRFASFVRVRKDHGRGCSLCQSCIIFIEIS